MSLLLFLGRLQEEAAAGRHYGHCTDNGGTADRHLAYGKSSVLGLPATSPLQGTSQLPRLQQLECLMSVSGATGLASGPTERDHLYPDH
jgi:hypothetical protein